MGVASQLQLQGPAAPLAAPQEGYFVQAGMGPPGAKCASAPLCALPGAGATAGMQAFFYVTLRYRDIPEFM